ncbi:MAG: hypothetical protein H0T62_09650 [Parachlamydiaceae bacterium]|nr:hypothetical protein [Parachlamydiaceae bacterium]
MTLNPINLPGDSLPIIPGAKIPGANSKQKEKSKESSKSTQIFKKISAAKQEDSEREYYVKDIMQQKGVSREVAEAEYDFFS